MSAGLTRRHKDGLEGLYCGRRVKNKENEEQWRASRVWWRASPLQLEVGVCPCIWISALTIAGIFFNHMLSYKKVTFIYKYSFRGK